MVAGQQVFAHPCCKGRAYILDKLMNFHHEHQTPADVVLSDLQNTIEQIPRHAHAKEATPLRKALEKTKTARCRGPQAIGEILPLVLAKLTSGQVQSEPSEDQRPGLVVIGREKTTPWCPHG